MKRSAAVLICAVLLGPAWAADEAGTPASGTAQSPAPETSAATTLEDAARATVMGNHAQAAAILKRVVAEPGFERKPESYRHVVWQALARAALYSGDGATAAAAARRATALPGADGEDWALRAESADAVGDLDEAADALILLAGKYPERLQSMAEIPLLQLAHRIVSRPDRSKGTDVLRAMFAAKWRPRGADPDRADENWYLLAVAEIQRNDLKAATGVVLDIHNPNFLVRVIIDRRFDKVVESHPDHFDIAVAAASTLQRTRARMEARPRSLESVYLYATALGRLDRDQEALTALDAALAKPQDNYLDRDESLPWATELRGKLLAALGRRDEGLEARKQAAALPENGALNVSQALNLAIQLISENKPREALDLLKKVPADRMSPYGRMVYETNRGCASLLLKDTATFDDAMHYIRVHASDSPKAALETLECAKDENGMAAEIIALFNDPVARGDTLLDFQKFCGPKMACEADDPNDFTIRVRQRPEVQAALAKVGRQMKFAIRYVQP